MKRPEVIVVGAGPSGISLAHTLKYKLGCSDFTVGSTLFVCGSCGSGRWLTRLSNQVYEKLDGVGGTWRTNTYPGV